MKAAVFYGAKDFRIENVEDPKIETEDILIKVRAAGICGSDLHAYKEGLFSRRGFVMGHEVAGEVVEAGAKVKGIKVGDRVSPMMYGLYDTSAACGKCFWCTRGQPQWCSSAGHKACGECGPCKTGEWWLCESNQRHMLMGYSKNGGYAEYAYVPYAKLGYNVFKIPGNLSYEEASFLDPVTGAYKWVNQGEPRSWETGVVTGLGTIGLTVMQVLKLYVSKVIVSDVSEKRLKLAKELGADVVINAAKEDPLKKVMELTGTGRSVSGKGGGCADIVMECSGVPFVMQQAVEMVRTGGRIVLVGLFEHDVALNMNHIIHKQLSLISSFSPGKQPANVDIREALELMAEGKVKVKPMISHEFPLDQTMEAFEIQTKADQSVKVIINP
ncbi:MAG: zinc-binding dehydrogenase [Dehalococcoidia bacterium]|jgi:threonine dehydrogenase-like Zn-dependent dehydrogenase